MNLSITKKLGISAIGTIIIAFILWQLIKAITYAQPLSKEEAAKKVQSLYHGEIVKVIEKQETFEITMNLETGTYDVLLDRETGNIKSMIQTVKKEVNKKDQSVRQQPIETTKKRKNAPSKADSSPISEKEAVAIAHQKIKGVVDDIGIEHSHGNTYYLIEIERDNGEEGTVQINALTGEVKSITWDD